MTKKLACLWQGHDIYIFLYHRHLQSVFILLDRYKTYFLKLQNGHRIPLGQSPVNFGQNGRKLLSGQGQTVKAVMGLHSCAVPSQFSLSDFCVYVIDIKSNLLSIYAQAKQLSIRSYFLLKTIFPPLSLICILRDFIVCAGWNWSNFHETWKERKIPYLFACWLISHAFLPSVTFFWKLHFWKKSYKNTTTVCVRLDLGPNCLPRFSSDDKSPIKACLDIKIDEFSSPNHGPLNVHFNFNPYRENIILSSFLR